MISKLGKEKRSVGDGRQKTEEDIQAAEDKCNHLSKVKGKLEQCLDESEDALEREKKVKGDVEKAKRKIEGDLKLTKEAVSDLERVKAELSGAVARKEKEGSALGAKIDDEATLASKYAKQAKELMARLEELDEELNIERGSRAKAEKSRTMLKKDIEDIGSRLEEAGSNTATQVELNKKREAELGRIKAELEELKIANEGTLAALRLKHNNTMGDLGEQIDSLNGNKVKSEKDKAGLELDLRDARLDLEDAVKGKAELDKTGKLLQGSIVDSNSRLDEMARALNEAESTKKRLQVENQYLNRQIEELEVAIANMNKGKISVTTQLEDSKALADAEAKDRASLLTKFKMMSTDLENLREKLENEAMRKSDAMKALSKAQAEIQLWKSRYETEGMGRIEELEGARAKLQAKIVENEELVDVLQTKVANAEKSKGRLGSDLDDISMEFSSVTRSISCIAKSSIAIASTIPSISSSNWRSISIPSTIASSIPCIAISSSISWSIASISWSIASISQTCSKLGSKMVCTGSSNCWLINRSHSSVRVGLQTIETLARGYGHTGSKNQKLHICIRM